VSAIALCSAKGSPGVTFLATALASVGRADGAVLVEADAAGGGLALDFGISESPGLAQLAARTRRLAHAPATDVMADLVRDVAPGGPRVVTAPVAPCAAETAVTLLAAEPLMLTSAAGPGQVIVDCGRVPGASCPGWPLLVACDVVCLVVRGDVVSLGHAAVLAEALREAGRPFVFALVDTGPYRAREAAAVLGARCAGTVTYPARRRSRTLRRAANTLYAALVEAARMGSGDHSAGTSEADVALREAVSSR
jgi:MinD-like ATPase involved in chromosome partitioning or flagellar assembly